MFGASKLKLTHKVVTRIQRLAVLSATKHASAEDDEERRRLLQRYQISGDDPRRRVWLNPLDAAAWRELGELEANTTFDPYWDREIFEIAVSLDPTDLEARFGLARALFEEGDYSAAIAACDVILRADMNNLGAIIWQPASFESLDQFGECIDRIDAALALDPCPEYLRDYRRIIVGLAGMSPLKRRWKRFCDPWLLR